MYLRGRISKEIGNRNHQRDESSYTALRRVVETANAAKRISCETHEPQTFPLRSDRKRLVRLPLASSLAKRN